MHAASYEVTAAERQALTEARGGRAMRRPHWEDTELSTRGQEMYHMFPACHRHGVAAFISDTAHTVERHISPQPLKCGMRHSGGIKGRDRNCGVYQALADLAGVKHGI